MKINSISLINFRNYDKLELSFDSSKNILVGENAQGKTNLLEAIYLTAFAKSFRTNNSADLIRFGCDMCTVKVKAERDELDKEISITINRSGKKMIKKDGKIVRKSGELLNNIVVVIFSPDDLRIIKDSPDKRRSFIDREMSQIRPRYHEMMKNYNAALKQKNTLLKDRREAIDIDVLDIFDNQLAQYGSEIVKYRKDFVRMLSERASTIHRNISGGKEELEIRYVMSQSDEGYYEALLANREKDMYAGFAVIGPHRDDIDFYINGKDAKKYGSQGQQRTIALSLKLAEIQIARDVIGENPILLLDDVLSELDNERQNYLIDEIKNIQLFLTTTEINEEILKKLPNNSVFNVFNGSVEVKRENFDE